MDKLVEYLGAVKKLSCMDVEAMGGVRREDLVAL